MPAVEEIRTVGQAGQHNAAYEQQRHAPAAAGSARCPSGEQQPQRQICRCQQRQPAGQRRHTPDRLFLQRHALQRQRASLRRRRRHKQVANGIARRYPQARCDRAVHVRQGDRVASHRRRVPGGSEQQRPHRLRGGALRVLRRVAGILHRDAVSSRRDFPLHRDLQLRRHPAGPFQRHRDLCQRAESRHEQKQQEHTFQQEQDAETRMLLGPAADPGRPAHCSAVLCQCCTV